MVTGSSGKIGREAVRALKAAGHRVVGLDLKGGTIDGIRTVKVDCTDFGQVMGAFSGVDTMAKPYAIVHLAGIPMPGLASDADIFQVNTLSTYNVFSACARLGIHRVIWASSETVLGLPFTRPPAYLPLDEDAPDLPNWSYSLSKHLGETMADQFVRWHPAMAIASLRFSNVFDTADYAARDTIDFIKQAHYPGTVEIATGLTHIGGSSYINAQAAFQHDACFALGEAVMVKAIDGRPAALTDDEKARMESILMHWL